MRRIHDRTSVIRAISSYHSIAHQYKQLHARTLRYQTCQSNAATWDELIKAYSAAAQNLSTPLGILTYKQMQSNGIKPTKFTFPPLLKSLAASAALPEGRQVHAHAAKLGHLQNIFVVHSLISFYARSAEIENARNLFDKIPVRNRVSWNVMIASYCQNGLFEEALALFRQMRDSNCGLDRVTMVSVLPACAHLGAIGLGKWIHCHVKERGGGGGGGVACVFLGTALIDMYCKCGFVERAYQVFDEMPERNIVTWNAMIGGFGMHGHSDRAFELFDRLRESSIEPNYVTFIGILCACTHAGLVEEGRRYFELMRADYSIQPTVQHYACMVDLLGRAGRLLDALELIEAMPFSPDAIVWGAFLWACRMHHDVELGKRAMTHLVELEPQNGGNYTIFSNMYANVGRWDEAAAVATKMKNRGIKKIPGCSWIEVDFKIHHFFAGDRSHPQTERIYDKLDELRRQLSTLGYVPNTGSTMRNIEEEDKEDALKIHSERLAIAFGLVSFEPCSTIHIVKNLRVCVDCHTVIKFISKIVDREIVVRDNSRFHHFRGGLCSCMDYW